MWRRRKKDDTLGGIVIGPALVFLALAALWKNEVRYDYYRAASRSTEIHALRDAAEDQVISYTGAMDNRLTLNGKYIESFTGYLIVVRSAEIYCWDESTDDEGHTTWSRRWMSRIDSNSRNRGLRQQLQSGRLLPNSYLIDDFEITADKIAFVDGFGAIAPPGNRTALRVSKRLVREANYLMLRKNRGGKLGDERISYRGLRVPPTATWFGKYSSGKGMAHDENQRDGFINQMIRDTGVLHHLVVGDRSEALATTRQHLTRLKWLVRAAGTFATYLGFQFFFWSIAKFVYGVPVIGWLAEKGTFVLAFILGVPLALLTIVCGFLFGHLYLFFVLLSALIALGAYLIGSRKQSKKISGKLRQQLQEKHGRTLDLSDIKELEFAELAYLALGNTVVSKKELGFLYRWGKQNGWEKDKVDELLQQVRSVDQIPTSEHPSDWHLNQLIQLALADGNLSPFEMRVVRDTARKAGFDRQTVDELMTKVQQSVA